MDPKAYDQMAQLEDVHWWFVARRQILSQVLQSLPLPAQTQILEAGCGSGGNLSLLAAFGTVWGMELSESARHRAQARNIGVIQAGHLPDRIPFEGQRFHLIALLDVLEHLDQDQPALRALADRLDPAGFFLITVPAYPWLWSRHDDLNHHKRRYTRPQLLQVVEQAGLKVEQINFFNFLLFPLVAGIRLAQRALKQTESDDLTLPSPLVNWILTGIFGLERFWITRMPMPFGVSLMVVARPRP